jgi:hypothetical protein
MFFLSLMVLSQKYLGGVRDVLGQTKDLMH